jgi:hypothetical protein
MWCWVSYFLKVVDICVIMLIVPSKSRKQCLDTHATLMIENSNNNCINPLMTKSKSHYSWRSVNQSVLVSSPFWGSWPDFTLSQVWLFRSFVSWGAPSDEGAGLSFVLCTIIHIVLLLVTYPIGYLQYIQYIYKASVSPGFVKQIMPYRTYLMTKLVYILVKNSVRTSKRTQNFTITKNN